MRVEVHELTRRFGRTTAIDRLSFTLGSGQIFAFVGPNGAGKTTTMRIMSTLDEPDHGDVVFDGLSVTQHPEKARRRFGFMPDALPATTDVVVWEYLDFFARAHGLRAERRRMVLDELTEFCALASLREKPLSALSKGMKQRVSLARALIHDPPLLILDEPAAGLDPRARVELRRLLAALAERGKAILISSHILSELEDIASGAVIIEQGRLIRAGTLDELHREELAPGADGVTAAHTRWIHFRPLGSAREALLRTLEIPGVLAAESEHRRVLARIEDSDEAAASLLQGLLAAGVRPIEFAPARVGLERLFMDSTKGEVQ